MEYSFQGKRVLVTGAGRGIGRTISTSLYNKGAKLVALDVPQLQAELDSLQKECPGTETAVQDLTDFQGAKVTIGKLGHFDLLVNNAGVLVGAPFLEMTEEQIDKNFDVNFKAVFIVSQVVAAGMVEQGTGGTIVNIASVTAKLPFLGLSAYAPSKSACENLSRAMALELAPYKIRVNSVNPNIVRTPLGNRLIADGSVGPAILERTLVGRYLETQDVANLVLFLLSDQSAMINGEAVYIDGGLSCH